MVASEGEKASAAEVKRYQSIMGEGNWLVQTTHPTLATSTSILSSYNKAPPDTAGPVLQYYLRYLQRAKDFALINRPENLNGFEVYSDSDWAGLYTCTGEVRSRTGSRVMFNGMPIAWRSNYQKCVGTSFVYCNTEDQVAMASGEAELYAAADTLKLALHTHYVAQELHLRIQNVIVMKVDATAAIGKIQGPRGGGKMKHIDLRQAWIRQLMDRGIVNVVKVDGTENRADFFTKVLGKGQFADAENDLMVKLE